AAPARRDVTDGRAGGGLRLALTRPLLVDRRGRDLLRALGRAALLLLALLDVFVLAFSLGAPGLLRHVEFPLRRNVSGGIPTPCKRKRLAARAAALGRRALCGAALCGRPFGRGALGGAALRGRALRRAALGRGALRRAALRGRPLRRAALGGRTLRRGPPSHRRDRRGRGLNLGRLVARPD